MHPAIPQQAVRLLGAPNLELAFLAANRADLVLQQNSLNLSNVVGKLLAKEAGATCFNLHNDQISAYGSIDLLKKVVDSL